MPRVYDRTPRAADDHNPLKNLLDFSDITPYAEQAGDTIRNALVGVIKELTGIDLTSWDTFLDTLESGGQIALRALVETVQQILDFFTNIVNGTVGTVGQGITDFFGAVGDFLNSITQGAEGTAIIGTDKVAVKNSIDGLRRATVSNTSAIEMLAAGSGALDNFNRTATDLGSDWLVVPIGTGTGNPATDGGNAVWRPAYPNGSLDCYCRWQGATLPTSTTDYQKGTVVFNTTPGIEYLSGGGVYYGTNSILLRCDASPTIDNYVQAIVRKDGAWVVFCVVANTLFPMFNGTAPAPGPGSVLDFYAGDKSKELVGPDFGLRDFRLVLNGNDLLPFTTEPTTQHSLVGSSYRGWGFHFGEQSTAFNLGTPVAIPGGINFWTANDQT